MLIQLSLTSPILYNISTKIFKIARAKNALLIKRGFKNKWFFDFKDGCHITSRKDWLINFKKLPPGYLIDTITGKIIKIEKISNI